MKWIVMMAALAVSVQAVAVENKDVVCSVTRYTTEIRPDGSKFNEQTVGKTNQTLSWTGANADTGTNADVRFEVDGMAMSASLSSEKCWDDDRMVECNQRSLFLSVYDRQNSSSTSSYYDLNSAAAGTRMNLTIQNPRGYHKIECTQVR